jgi:pimeloyl-ACP methyl ester carboxylesterase
MKKSISLTFLLIFIFNALPAQEVFQRLSYPYEVRQVGLHDGEQMAFVDVGAGPEVLVFIHGEESYLPAWMKNIDELSREYRCIAVDLIGYGKSSKPMETNLLLDHSEYIAELMDSLSIHRYNLIGHAMGGQIAIHHSLTYPNRVRKLVLIAPTGIEKFEGAQSTMVKTLPSSSIINTTQEAIIAQIRNYFFQFPEEAGFMITDRIAMAGDPQIDAYAYAVTGGIIGIIDQPVSGLLGNIQAPTMVLIGAEDRVIPNSMYNPDLTQEMILEKVHQSMPNVETHLIPAGGHMVMFERYDVVNALIRDFMIDSHLRR